MKSKQLKKTKKIKYKKRKTLIKKQKGRGNSSSKLSADYSSNPVLFNEELLKQAIERHANENQKELNKYAYSLEDEFTPLPDIKKTPYKKLFPKSYESAEKTNKSNRHFLRAGPQKIEITDSFDILGSNSNDGPVNFGGKKKKGK
jgi:hypothetical protein